MTLPSSPVDFQYLTRCTWASSYSANTLLPFELRATEPALHPAMADRIHPAPLLPLSTTPPFHRRAATTRPWRPRCRGARRRTSWTCPRTRCSEVQQAHRTPGSAPPPPLGLLRVLPPARPRHGVLRRCLPRLPPQGALLLCRLRLHRRPRITPTRRRGLLPGADADVRADNGVNRQVGVDYRSGGVVVVAYSGVQLVIGRWPAFYQPPRNVTLVSMKATSSVRTCGG